MKRKILALALIFAVTMLVGCGAQPAAKPSQPASSNKKADTQPKQLGSVTIGKAVDTIGFSTVDVAIKQGYFKQLGVDVKVQLLGGSSQANAALTSGSLQFTTASSSALMLARENGVPLLAVASLDYGIPLQLIVSNKWIKDRNLSKKQPLEERARGLSGINFGEVGPTDLSYMLLLLKKAGLSDSAIHVIKFQAQSGSAAAMTNGSIDAFVASPPSTIKLEADGLGQNLVNFREFPEMKNAAYDILITTNDNAQKNPDVVKAVATAIAMADNFMLDHPQETLAIEKEHFPNFSSEVLQKSLELCTFSRNGLFTGASQWDDAFQLAVSTGILKGQSKPEEGTAWTNKFIDVSKLTGK